MIKVKLPYGEKEVELCLPSENEINIYEPEERSGVADVEEAVKASLAHPVGLPPLREIAHTGQKVAIVVDDASRDVPTSELLRPLVAELTAGGVRKEDITVIVATGLHRALNESEQRRLLGRLQGELTVINHEPRATADLTYLARTGLGTEVYLNRVFLQADLKVLTGDVEFHQFVGYGGGAKSVFPGLADAKSIELSHSRMELDGTGPGRLDGNPVREEIEEVGRMAGIDFIINVVLNSHKEVVGVFSGDCGKAFRRGAELCDRIYRMTVPRRVDLVLASAGGYPRDIDLYQSQKAAEAGKRIVKRGGRIVVLAECREGHGSQLSYQWMKEAACVDDVYRKIKERFVMGGHKAYQFARVIKWADVYLYSSLNPEMVRTYFMHPLVGLQQIEQLIQPGDTVAILPLSVLTLAALAEEQEEGE